MDYQKAYLVSNPVGPGSALFFDEELCIGCNICVNSCRSDVMMPNPEAGRPPIVVYPDECWFCGCCVEECPFGAVTLVPPAKQLVSTVWVRKETGEEFRLGMNNPPAPNTKPYSGRN
jgi:Na+-translocating ferredoxin:NAD+ oxidoreductase RNF subunit RnfB